MRAGAVDRRALRGRGRRTGSPAGGRLRRPRSRSRSRSLDAPPCRSTTATPRLTSSTPLRKVACAPAGETPPVASAMTSAAIDSDVRRGPQTQPLSTMRKTRWHVPEGYTGCPVTAGRRIIVRLEVARRPAPWAHPPPMKCLAVCQDELLIRTLHQVLAPELRRRVPGRESVPRPPAPRSRAARHRRRSPAVRLLPQGRALARQLRPHPGQPPPRPRPR